MVAIDNIVRLTGRNHWPWKRETPEEMKSHEIKNQMMKSVPGKGKTDKEWKIHKNKLGLQGMTRGLYVVKKCFHVNVQN